MIEALDDVPDSLREMVRFYLNDWIEKAGGLTALKNLQRKQDEKGSTKQWQN